MRDTRYRLGDIVPPVAAAFLITLLAATGAVAQVTTGKLIGRVTDDSGTGLPGATVTIRSPQLLGGPRVEETEADGGYEFPLLAPGTYSVQVDLDGFVSQERTEVEVRLDRTTEIRVQMVPVSDTFSGEVVVTAQTPVVDPQQVSTSVNFDELYLENATVGTASRSYQNVLVQAPGVTTVAGGGSNPAVFGSTYQENAFYIDGSNTTDPVTMTFGSNFNFDAIQEISFQTGGFEAEYGNATGGVVNVITKSGGNDLSGTLDVRYDDDGFREDGEFFDSDTQKVENFDPAATLGGPVLHDRLWFFTSWEHPEADFQAAGSPTARTFAGDYYLGKLSWQAAPSWQIVGQVTGDPAEIENGAANPEARLPESQAFQEQGGTIAQLSATGVLSDRLLIDVKLSRNEQELDTTPMSGDLETPGFQNVSTGLWTNNYANAQFSSRDRDEAKVSLSYFADEIVGDHEIKVGAEFSDLEFSSANFTTGDRLYTTRTVNGVEIPRNFSSNPNRDVTTSTGEVLGVYAQDAWSPLPSLTLKLGLRYDQAKFVNNIGNDAGDLDKVQPRLGVAWDVTGDGKTYLRGSWGRFMHPASTRLPSINAFDASSQPRVIAWSCNYLRVVTFGAPGASCQEIAEAAQQSFGFEGSIVQEPLGLDPEGYVVQSIIGATGEGILIDPDLDATYADTLVLSAEREIFRRTSVELTWVDKQTEDIFEDTCDGNLDGSRVPGHACTNFALTNLPELTREYQGAILQLETRAVDWLHVISSLTWSESKGSIEATQFAGGDYDFFPDDFVNRFGFLSDHRRWRFKLNGYAQLPKRFTLGFNGFYSSPYVFDVTDSASTNGSDVLFVERRGSREGNSNYRLDLQLSKAFSFGGVDLSLIGSVINALDSERPTRRCEDVNGCALGGDVVDLGDPIVWQTPRRYQAGIRVVF